MDNVASVYSCASGKPVDANDGKTQGHDCESPVADTHVECCAANLEEFGVPPRQEDVDGHGCSLSIRRTSSRSEDRNLNSARLSDINATTASFDVDPVCEARGHLRDERNVVKFESIPQSDAAVPRGLLYFG